MRAKKFGVTAFSDDAKKLVRAERFGISNSSSSIGSGKTVSNRLLIQGDIVYFSREKCVIDTVIHFYLVFLL